jgi:hypothetical protein
MPHEFHPRDRPSGEPGPIRPTAALHHVARLLDGRARTLGDIDEIAEILRRAGYTVRDPEEIKVRCPNCGGPDITVCYDSIVGVRIVCDEIRSVTMYGFAGLQPVRIFCPNCDAEYDEADLRDARAREIGGELDPEAAHGTEDVEALRRAARAVVETLDAASGLVPDRYRNEVRLEGVEGAGS